MKSIYTTTKINIHKYKKLLQCITIYIKEFCSYKW